jgi:hypothetical protein
MVVEENLKSKLYKVELGLLKVIPMFTALCYALNSILSCFYIDIYIFSYIAGLSFLPLIFLYISSYVFRFCSYHRMFLHYIVANEIINIIDDYIGIPVSDKVFLTIHLFLICFTLFIILYLYVKSHKETPSKIH